MFIGKIGYKCYLESQKVFFDDWKVVRKNSARLASTFGVILLEEWYGDVEARPVVLVREAGLGQDGLSDVKVQVFRVVGIRSGVEVEDDVIKTLDKISNFKQFNFKRLFLTNTK